MPLQKANNAVTTNDVATMITAAIMIDGAVPRKHRDAAATA